MMEDALRVAENYMPSKLQEIHLEFADEIEAYPELNLNENVSNSNKNLRYVEKKVSKARAYEKGHDFGKAIETYLSIGIEDCSNYNLLQKVI